MDILKRDSNSINIASFWEGYSLNKFNFDPPYQRDSVWNEEKQSFFIDSILRNYPIPPIFLHQKIDTETGKIMFEVVDGKQRLTAIVKFIEGVIASSSEDDDDQLTGVFFQDLSKPELSEVKKHFWRYQMPVEYIDTENSKTIDSIFDRLNRNGEKLNGQELRNAKFHGSEFYGKINEIAEHPYWSKILSTLDKKRMEEKEFLSELIFTILEGDIIGSNQETIDELYEKYSTMDMNKLISAFIFFDETTNYLSRMDIDYEAHKAGGVSHLYGFFNMASYCIKNKIDIGTARTTLEKFLISLWKKEITEGQDLRIEYRKTMSSSTKSKSQRSRRTNVLINLLRG
jgi:uncharacterized protein with ParB-like and HNH nuclease domain